MPSDWKNGLSKSIAPAVLYVRAVPLAFGSGIGSELRRPLGLTIDLSPFGAMAAQDPLLGPLAARMPGLKPRAFSLSLSHWSMASPANSYRSP